QNVGRTPAPWSANRPRVASIGAARRANAAAASATARWSSSSGSIPPPRPIEQALGRVILTVARRREEEPDSPPAGSPISARLTGSLVPGRAVGHDPPFHPVQPEFASGDPPPPGFAAVGVGIAEVPDHVDGVAAATAEDVVGDTGDG